jgi:hypothetical protein
MRIKDLKHFHIANGIFWIVMVGVFTWNPLQGTATLSENDARKDVIQGREELGEFIIEGEVTRVQGDFVGKDFSQMKDRRYVVETPYGRAWDLHLEEYTQIGGPIFVGDQVKASLANNGSLQTVQKIEQNNSNSKHSMVRRSIKGMLERRNGNFLYVKQGDHTEIVHLDPQSVLEGNIREGSNIVAQLGEAGYGIKIQELTRETETNSN